MSTLTTGTYEKYGASYKTLTLTDGEYAFTVTPEKGGMATSFTKNGDEYLNAPIWMSPAEAENRVNFSERSSSARRFTVPMRRPLPPRCGRAA